MANWSSCAPWINDLPVCTISIVVSAREAFVRAIMYGFDEFCENAGEAQPLRMEGILVSLLLPETLGRIQKIGNHNSLRAL